MDYIYNIQSHNPNQALKWETPTKVVQM